MTTFKEKVCRYILKQEGESKKERKGEEEMK